MLAGSREAAEQAPAVVEKMLAEAQRAGEIVRRLRDFFRTGTTRLEPVAVKDLLASARAAAEQAKHVERVSIEFDAEAGLPLLYVDRLQVELVLRNLIANAVEAVAGQDGQVRVLAQRHGIHHVLFVVLDNGPGVDAAVRDRLFEPFSSAKAGGLGLGLAVSRAMAEANGGSLEARPARHGEFHLILPCRKS